jgi:hypothetical protein
MLSGVRVGVGNSGMLTCSIEESLLIEITKGVGDPKESMLQVSGCCGVSVGSVHILSFFYSLLLGLSLVFCGL